VQGEKEKKYSYGRRSSNRKDHDQLPSCLDLGRGREMTKTVNPSRR